jgi:biopolymer transport protein TolQ
LAVVAPGIAEALFVTAMGLVAAIPAVVAYNKINKSVDKYYNKLSNFSDELVSVLNKHLYQNFYKA